MSVVIVYYKRRDTIAEAIESALRQDYSRREVIVVDNHSEDGLNEWIKSRGYDVHVVELDHNCGACAGRNAGIRNSHGEIIVCTEDDVSFLSEHEISNIVEKFELRPDVHALALRICDPNTGRLRLREWCHPRYWRDFCEQEFETDWFGEGASAFRREVFTATGGYYEPFFYGAEGDDLVIRMFNYGYKILYTPNVRVGHRAAEEGRSGERQYYFFTRNYVWTALKNYGFWAGIRYFTFKLAMMFYLAMRSGNIRHVLRGLRDGLRGARQARRDRTPATAMTIRRLRELERTRPNLFVRLARHRKSPQL